MRDADAVGPAGLVQRLLPGGSIALFGASAVESNQESIVGPALAQGAGVDAAGQRRSAGGEGQDGERTKA